MPNKQIVIPISEGDISLFKQLVYDNYDPFIWTFDNVDIMFEKEEMEE